MPELEIAVGGKTFTVACQPGEEEYLRAAAAQLDAEARTIVAQAPAGRLPEVRMLLMAGLMLADRLAGVEDQLRAAQARVTELEGRPAARIEVPVIPTAVAESLAEIAARAEALAAAAEERTGRQAAG